MRWNINHIEELKRKGKIKGYSGDQVRRKVVYKENGVVKEGVLPKDRPEGLVWLDWNLAYWCNERSLTLQTEYRFDRERRWRFDYAIPARKWAIEYEGGIFQEKGGHTTAKGFDKDIAKYTRAQVLGWTVIRVTASNYKTVLETLNQLL